MLFIGSSYNWVESIKYLGVHKVGGKNLSFNAAFNNICSHTKPLEEVVQLTLHESYCLPLLTYAAGAVSYNQRQVHDLNVCWNTVYRIVFNFNRWESVKSFINGLGKLSVQYILKVRAVKFYYHLLHVANSVLNELFSLHFEDFYDKDDCLHHIMCSTRHVAIAAIHERFNTDCQP